MLSVQAQAIRHKIERDERNTVEDLPIDRQVEIVILPSLSGLEIRIFGPGDSFSDHKTISLRLVHGGIEITNTVNNQVIILDPYIPQKY